MSGTIVGKARLVVLIYKMVGEQVDIFLGGLLAIHLLDAVGEQTAVETDEIRLGQLAYEGGDILVLYIGVGVILRACGCIGSLAIVGEELQFFHRLAVCGVRSSLVLHCRFFTHRMALCESL